MASRSRLAVPGRRRATRSPSPRRTVGDRRSPASRRARVVDLATRSSDRSRSSSRPRGHRRRVPRRRGGSSRARASIAPRGSGTRGRGRRLDALSRATSAQVARRRRSTVGRSCRRRGSTDRRRGSGETGTGLPVVPLYGHTSFVDDVSLRPGRRRRHGEPRPHRADVGRERAAARRCSRGHRRRRHRTRSSRRTDAVVTAGADGTVRLWDPGTRHRARAVGASSGPAPPRKRADDAPAATSSPTRSATSFASRARRDVQTIRGHARRRQRASRSAPTDRLLVTASRDHDVDRLGRRDRRAASIALLRGPVGVGRRRAVQPRRPLDRHRRADARRGSWNVGRRPSRSSVPLRPESAASPRSRFERRLANRSSRASQDGRRCAEHVCELCGGLDELPELARSRLARRAALDRGRARAR